MAEKELKLSIKLNPEMIDAYLNLGIIYYKKGKIKDSEKYFKKAIKIDPNYAKAHNNLGSVYFKQGKFNEALKEYNKVLQLDKEGEIGVMARYNIEKIRKVLGYDLSKMQNKKSR
jgi:tetratricopeptide (TPR) repeat protein